MKLKKITLQDFKGVKEATYEFNDEKTVISGKNGSGKTTVFDAHLWLWADKDASLRSDPNIRPDGVEECTPTVTEVWDVDGTEVSICKMQKMKKSKPDANGVVKTSTNNTYAINSVPKTQRDFKADLTERGFDLEHFLVLSHAEVFAGMKDTEMRKALFAMVKDQTDAEIAAQTNGCEKIAELLKMYRLDEIVAMEKATKKKSDEMLKKIPGVIEGLELSKVPDNRAHTVERQTAILAEIEILKEERDKPSEVDAKVAELTAKKDEAIKNLENRKAEISEAWHKTAAEQKEVYFTAQTEFNRVKSELAVAVSTADNLTAAQSKAQETVTRLQAEYKRTKANVPSDRIVKEIEARTTPADATVCPTCHREYPEAEAKKIVAKFRKDNENALKLAKKEYERAVADYNARLEDNVARGKAAAAERNALIKKVGDAVRKVDELKDALADAAKKLEASKPVDPKPVAVVCAEDPAIKEMMGEIASISMEISNLRASDNGDRKREIDTAIAEKRSILDSLTGHIAKIDHNKEIDAQIAAQEKNLRDFAQAKADAEEILDEVDRVSKNKNTLLAEAINSHFKVVRWKLFDYFKNGEYKEVTIPEVFDTVHEEWRSIGSTANTALELLGKLDIVAGFQGFYGVHLPLFLDGAERLDSVSTGRVEMPCQMIFLKVTDGELEVK